MCIEAAENNELCAMREIAKHYKIGARGFPEDSAKSKYWTSLAENIVGIARSPQSGWSGAVKICD